MTLNEAYVKLGLITEPTAEDLKLKEDVLASPDIKKMFNSVIYYISARPMLPEELHNIFAALVATGILMEREMKESSVFEKFMETLQ